MEHLGGARCLTQSDGIGRDADGKGIATYEPQGQDERGMNTHEGEVFRVEKILRSIREG